MLKTMTQLNEAHSSRVVEVTHRVAQDVLRALVREVGLGFHPDTQPRDYVDANDHAWLSPQEQVAMRFLLENLRGALGDEIYEIANMETEQMYAESTERMERASRGAIDVLNDT